MLGTLPAGAMSLYAGRGTLVERLRTGGCKRLRRPGSVASHDRICAISEHAPALLGLLACHCEADGVQRAKPHLAAFARLNETENPALRPGTRDLQV